MTKRRSSGSLFLKLLGVIVFIPAIGFAQGQERIIDKISWRTEPIKILKLRTKDKAIELGKKFSEEDDWLKGLTVTVENVSNKLISRIELNLSFPRPEGSSEEIPTYTVRMIYGREPSDTSEAEAQKQVLPGESVDVKLLEVNLPFIKEDLEKLGYPEKITRAQIMVDTVTFSDGAMWGGDEMLYPDPTNPKEKINPKFPLPKKLKPASNQSALPCKSLTPRFRNSSFRSMSAPAMLNHSKVSSGKFWLTQDPTLPCNTIWVTQQTHTCGPSGAGCTYKLNVFQDSPLGLLNARRVLDTVRCVRSDGTFCTPTPMSNFRRLPCGAQFVGCVGPVALRKGSPKDPSPLLPVSGCCDDTERYYCEIGGGTWDDPNCTCISPIVIDVAGNGFNLTNAGDGVTFDIIGKGIPEQISWTSANSDDAWLSLDRNGNGMIDDGTELFGSSSPQPYLTPGESKNGFRALGMFDTAEYGGNGDGQIDQRDGVFSSLKLWQDRNHNGVSEAEELQSLSISVIRVIELRYREPRRHDENGNWFRYRAKVRDARGAQVGRWAWDVFLQKVH